MPSISIERRFAPTTANTEEDIQAFLCYQLALRLAEYLLGWAIPEQSPRAIPVPEQSQDPDTVPEQSQDPETRAEQSQDPETRDTGSPGWK